MIVNHTRKKVVCKKEKVCRSLFSQARGLMFSSKRNLLMVFPAPRRVSLHNFFVFYPLTLVLVGEDFRVCEVKRGFRPFSLYRSRSEAKYLLESPFPVCVKVGDRLGLTF